MGECQSNQAGRPKEQDSQGKKGYADCSQQLALGLSNGFISLSITLGFGKPLWQFDFRFLPQFLLYSNVAGSFSILAAQLSKTSFAITVLRISSGGIKWLIWFIILSVNVALGLAIAFTWVQCDPIRKTWEVTLDGTCWNKMIVVRYNIFTASKWCTYPPSPLLPLSQGTGGGDG